MTATPELSLALAVTAATNAAVLDAQYDAMNQ